MNHIGNRTLPLENRRYTLLDGPRICFRCAPAAAFLYGFFELAAAALAPLGTLAVAGFIDAAVTAVRDGGGMREVFTNLGFIAAIAAFRWLEKVLHNFADLKLVIALRERYRTALTEKRTRLAYRHIEDAASWDLVRRVADNPEGGRLKTAYFHLVDLAAFILKVGGLLAILMSAVWWGGLAVVAVSSLTLVTGIRGGKRQYREERETARHDRRTDYLGSVLLGRDAAAERALFGFIPRVTAMWNGSHASGMRIRMKARFRWYRSAYTGNVVTLGSWVFIMVIMLKPLAEGTLSVGLFIALSQAFTNLDIVWGFMETVHGIAADGEFFGDLTAFMALEEQSGTEALTGGPLRTAPADDPAPGFASLELRGVRFSYPGAGEPVLEGLDCRFEPGRHYAIVGANGAGKTTITRLITGLYQPESGEVLLNGLPLTAYPYRSLVSRFSLVYQDFARYCLTLRENILLGSETEPCWPELLDDVGLAETVGKLPRGLDTPLGKLMDDGVDLSGGEWQRVAMARALASPAPLLILDEPAASLDPVAESRLYELFDRITSGRTTILISHRLGATRIADTILVLHGGRVAESGGHGELMRSDGLYRRMFESQRSWYE